MISPAILACAPGGGGPVPYHADAVRFNAGTYLARGGTLTGVSNSPTGVVFYWFRSDPSALVSQNILASIPGYTVNPYDLASVVNVTVATAGFTNQYSAATDGASSPDVDDGSWYGIARSWDTTDANPANWVSHIVVGEAGDIPIEQLQAIPSKSGIGFSAQWNDMDFYVGGDGSEDVFREYAQMWASPGVFMTAAQLIAAFWGVDNKPKDLGANGELPTGSSPPIYLDGLASAWNTNKGTGGNMATVGDPITNASTSPSD